jgi:glucokinase
MTTPQPDLFVTLGFDVGGTKILGGIFGHDGTRHFVISRPTPGRRVAALLLEDLLTEMVGELCQLATEEDLSVRAVGLAVAGLCATNGHFVFAPHLPWVDEPLAERLGTRWQLPVVLDNDANCAGTAEYRFGAGAHTQSHGLDVDPLLLVTVGTGIGGALVTQGRAFRGASGLASEFGHMRITDNTRTCECGGTGCWEQVCSGNQLRRLFGKRASGREVSSAARSGDQAAQAAFAEVGHWLGVGLVNLTAAFDPALIVIGGGVSNAGELLLAPARQVLNADLLGRGHRPPPEVVPAELGQYAGVLGAGLLAHELVAAH